MTGSQSFVNQPYRHRALADCRGHAFDRARVNVADGEDPGTTGLQKQWAVPIELSQIIPLKISAGEQESGLVRD